MKVHFHCGFLYPITEQNIFNVTNQEGVTAKKESYMSVFSVELGGMTSGSGLWSSGWQRSESRLEENKNEKQLQFCFFLIKIFNKIKKNNNKEINKTTDTLTST